MGRILFVDYNKEEWDRVHSSVGDYDEHVKGLQIRADFIRRLHHDVRIITALEDLTDDLYHQQDAVFAHPASEKSKRLIELHGKYPHVGLILTTGSGSEHDNLVSSLRRTMDGIFFLDPPYLSEEMIEALNKVLKK